MTTSAERARPVPGTGPAALRARWARSRWTTGSRTRRLLEAQLLAMLVLSVAGVVAVFASYRATHLEAVEARTRAVPAVSGVAAAELALRRADAEAQAVRHPDAVALVGEGENYRMQMASADQTLSRVAALLADQDGARAQLDTVNGLLSTYEHTMAQASLQYAGPGDRRMKDQKLRVAGDVLHAPGDGITDRLGELRADRREAAAGVLAMSDGERWGWAAGVLCLTGLAGTTGWAWLVIRRRCGRRYSPWLCAALPLTAALAVLPLWQAVSTREALDRAGGNLDDVIAHVESVPPGPVEAQVLDDAQQLVGAGSRTAAGLLPDSAWQRSLYYGCPVAGLLVVTLPAAGVVRRLNADYWRTRT